MRIFGLLAVAIICAGCCANSTASSKARYIVTLAIYPDKSCFFVSSHEVSSNDVEAGLKPSEAFLKVACGYFLATYKIGASVGAPSSTEVVGWYANDPDIPRYMPNVQM
jgi:hypothetical protein